MTATVARQACVMSLAQRFTIHHFLPLTHRRGTQAAFGLLLRDGHRPILDLEDGVGCMFDVEKNRLAKAKARDNLVVLIDSLQDTSLLTERILIRINQRGGDEYQRDLDVLVACVKRGFCPTILLSKTNSPEDVIDCCSSVAGRTGRTLKIIPILESVAGVDALEEIMAALPKRERTAVFGYFDYALDAGHWPMMNPLGEKYWKLFESVCTRVESMGGNLMAGAFPHLHSEEKLLRVKAILMGIANRDTGLCSLSMEQTKIFSREVAQCSVPEDVEEMDSPEEHAHWVVHHFETERRNQRSFAVVGDQFVTPHEYVLARKFLGGQDLKS